MPEINKCFAFAEKKEFLDEENSIVCYASTNEVDRHGEMILSTAWTDKGLENYRKNPIILVNHNYNSLPVAKSLWQKTDGNGLKFKIKFADTENGREIYSLYKDGYMSSFSVGFRPVKMYDNEDTKKYKDKNGNVPHTVYEECELLELSCVTIPANPSATMLSGMKSFIDSYEKGNFKSEEVKAIAEQIKSSKEYIELTEPTETKAKKIGFIDLEIKDIDLSQANELDMEKYQEKTELVEKIETTDEYHHIPVKDKSQFVDGSFKTIDITSGVKAIIGKLKSDPQGSTHVQKYLFDVDKFSLEEAKKWVSDHNKSMDEDKPCKQENGKCKKDCPKYDDCEDEMKKAMHENKPKKPCKQEGGECMEDCEEYGTCEDEAKKSFEQEEVKNEDTIEDKGISDDSEAGLLDIPDNGTGEVDEIVEEKEVNLDEIESKNEEIIENNVEEKTVKIDISQIKEMVDELKSYINEIVEEKLKFFSENADKVNMEENSEVEEKQVDFIELKEPEKIDFEFKEKTVDVDFDPEEIKSMMKSAILTTVNDSKSMDKLVEERIRRMKGIIDFE